MTLISNLRFSESKFSSRFGYVLVYSNELAYKNHSSDILIRAVCFDSHKRIGSYESLVRYFDSAGFAESFDSQKNKRLIRVIRSTTLVALYVSNAR